MTQITPRFFVLPLIALTIIACLPRPAAVITADRVAMVSTVVIR